MAGATLGGVAGRRAGELLSNAWFASSASRMQREVVRGRAPRGIERVDKGNPSDPGDLEPHVHFEDGRALKQSGQWKHGSGEVPRAFADWLRSHGWSVPQ
jgi:hypothetical protein